MIYLPVQMIRIFSLFSKNNLSSFFYLTSAIDYVNNRRHYTSEMSRF